MEFKAVEVKVEVAPFEKTVKRKRSVDDLDYQKVPKFQKTESALESAFDPKHLHKLQELTARLGTGSEFIYEALSLFTALLNGKRFSRIMDWNGHLAASLIYASKSTEDQKDALRFREVATAAQMDLSLLGKYYKSIQRCLQQDAAETSSAYQPLQRPSASHIARKMGMKMEVPSFLLECSCALIEKLSLEEDLALAPDSCASGMLKLMTDVFLSEKEEFKFRSTKLFAEATIVSTTTLLRATSHIEAYLNARPNDWMSVILGFFDQEEFLKNEK